MKRYRVYALVDPRTGEPFYVGATTSRLKRRLRQHVQATRMATNNKELRARLADLIDAGLKPRFWLLERTWLPDREGEWINHLLDEGYLLLNVLKLERSVGATVETCDIVSFRSRHRL